MTFHPLDDSKTRVMVQFGYEPQDVVEKTGDALGIVSKRLQGDLERFKEMIESRGRETGAWRGEIAQHEVR